METNNILENNEENDTETVYAIMVKWVEFEDSILYRFLN